MKQLENIQRIFKSAQKEVNVLLRRYKWKEVLTFLFFVVLSFGFWVLQSLQEEYEIQVNIPIRYRDMPPDITFVEAPPPAVTARVRDKGSILLNYTLGRTLSSIDLSMKELPAGSGTFYYARSDMEGAIMKHLISTTSLLSFSPQQIQAAYSKLEKKTLPVVFAGDIQTVPGFVVSEDVAITPEEVTVYASDVVLDTLKAIRTEYTVVKEARRPVERTLRLEKISGVTVEPAKVAVRIVVEEFTEKTLELPVAGMDIPAGYTMRMFPPTVKVTCTIPLSRYVDLTVDDFTAEVSAAYQTQSVSGLLPVSLAKKPGWVNKVTISPDSIEYILEPVASDD